ncbi:hypothetical protein BDW72DRAFT_195708 [Aspergillus terricola var. indicus]
MAQAKEIGAQEEEAEGEEERKRMEIGEGIAASIGLANLARVIAIAGELGIAALATYDTVNNPDAAVVSMLGMLFGAGAFTKVSRDAKGLKDVARYRRGVSTGEIALLGKFLRMGMARCRLY